MNEKIETQGKSVDEAVNEALLRLGARRDEVEVTVLEEAKSGFLGLLGGRPAKVAVARKQKQRRNRSKRNDNSGQAHEFGDASGGNRRPSRNNSRRNSQQKNPQQKSKPQGGRKDNQKAQPRQEQPRDGRPAKSQSSKSQPSKSQSRESQPREDQRTRRGRPRNQRRNQGDARPAPAARVQSEEPNGNRAPQETSNQRPAQKNRRERQPRPARQDRQPRREPDNRRQERPAARMGNSNIDEVIATGINAGRYAQPVTGIAAADVNSNLEKMATGLLARAGFPTRCEVVSDEYLQVKITTDDESAGMLIGRHGSTIDSVEHLVERMISNAAGDRVRMNLDINNYRLRRHENLLQRVEEAVGQVRESGKTYHVEPMNARERRIVHLAAEKYDGIRTFTMDSHRGRHVIIALDLEKPEEQDVAPEVEGADAPDVTPEA